MGEVGFRCWCWENFPWSFHFFRFRFPRFGLFSWSSKLLTQTPLKPFTATTITATSTTTSTTTTTTSNASGNTLTRKALRQPLQCLRGPSTANHAFNPQHGQHGRVQMVRSLAQDRHGLEHSAQHSRRQRKTSVDQPTRPRVRPGGMFVGGTVPRVQNLPWTSPSRPTRASTGRPRRPSHPAGPKATFLSIRSTRPHHVVAPDPRVQFPILHLRQFNQTIVLVFVLRVGTMGRSVGFSNRV